MFEEPYRLVTFTANYCNDYIDIENMKETQGYFHRWAEDIVSAHDKYFTRVVALVEAKNGTVYKVPPERIVFETESEKKARQMKELEEL